MALYKFLRKYKSDLFATMHQTAEKTPGEIFDALKEILEKKPSSVKEGNRWKITPLQRVLWNRELSTLSIVNLILSYGADVDCREHSGLTPLHIALDCHRGEDVIRALLEKGADATVRRFPRTFLCFAFQRNVSLDVIQLLLGAGCSTDLCTIHGGCALRCATQRETRTSKEVIRLFIEMGVNLNVVDEDGRSPLCHILENGAELWIIDLLVAAGGSLYACTRHASPVHCATKAGVKDKYVRRLPSLRADVIKKLLKDDDPVQISDPIPLQNALRCSSSGKEVIKVLFDHLQGSRTVLDQYGNTLLHLAVSNEVSKLSVVEFLIESGVEVNLVNDKGETPLHLAVAAYKPRSSLVKILLKAGSSANALNARGENPLQLAVRFVSGHPSLKFNIAYPETKDVDILKMLFMAGSRVGIDAVRSFVCRIRYDKSPIRRIRYDKSGIRRIRYEKTIEEKINYCNMLVKYCLLENPDFHIEHLIEGHPNCATLSAFGADCERELHSMKSTIVGEGRTLRDLLDDHSSHQVVEYDFNQLDIIADDAFPVYFDIIASKIIGRLAMEEVLREVHVCTPRNISGPKEMIALNYHVVCNIADRLTDDDLLRFILAFRKMDRMCTARARNENAFEGKRSGEQSEQCPKRPKLQI